MGPNGVVATMRSSSSSSSEHEEGNNAIEESVEDSWAALVVLLIYPAGDDHRDEYEWTTRRGNVWTTATHYDEGRCPIARASLLPHLRHCLLSSFNMYHYYCIVAHRVVSTEARSSVNLLENVKSRG